MVPEDDPQWVRFWSAYPLRRSKQDARKAWAKLNPPAVLVDQMLEALAWQARQPGWLKDDGQYIPLPATWLNGARWEDEPPMKIQRVMSDAASLVFQTLNMGKP